MWVHHYSHSKMNADVCAFCFRDNLVFKESHRFPKLRSAFVTKVMNILTNHGGYKENIWFSLIMGNVGFIVFGASPILETKSPRTYWTKSLQSGETGI